jgi:hypothetical protein
VRDPSVLFVVGNEDFDDEDGDGVVENLLKDLGFDVDTIEDVDAADEDNIGDNGLIIVSSSVSAGTLEDEFRGSRVPVLVMDSGVFDDMQMTDEDESQQEGTEQGRDISIVNDTHPIAAGLKGQILVSNTISALQWGVPGRGATIIATLAADPTKATIFAYDAGAEMVDRTAPHRRVGFFAAEAITDKLSREGQQLLESAILWTWSGGNLRPPPPPPRPGR